MPPRSLRRFPNQAFEGKYLRDSQKRFLCSRVGPHGAMALISVNGLGLSTGYNRSWACQAPWTAHESEAGLLDSLGLGKPLGSPQLRSAERSQHHFLEQSMMQVSGLWDGRTIYKQSTTS